MQITHVKSNIVPDFTGTVTVYDNSGSTQTVAATNLVRPSDWNSAHALAITLTGNTAGESTVSGTNIIWQGGPNITLSGSAGTVLISGGAGGGGGVAVSAGAASVSNGTVVFSNSHNVSFGLNGSTVTASASYSQSTAPGAIAAGTQTATSGTMVFSNSNGITFGMSGSTRITASHNAITSQSNQQISGYAVSNTTQSSSGTLNAANLSFAGAGIASVGVSNGSVVISVPSGGGAGDGVVSLGMSTEGNTAGTTGTVSSGRMIFVGSGPISLSQSQNGQSGTLSILGPATSSLSATGFLSISTNGSTISIGAGPLSFYATGNTTQSSSGTIDGRSITIQGTGGASVGVSNGSIVISGAAAGGGGGITRNGYQPHLYGAEMVAGAHGAGTLFIQPMPEVPDFQHDRIVMPLQISNATNSSGSWTLSVSVGIYTKNASTLSLVNSTSTSFNATASGTVGSYSLFGGIRHLTIPWTSTRTAGDYWIGIWSRTTSGGVAGMTLNQMLASQPNSSYSGILGAASNATDQFLLGQGRYSATTTGFPGSVGFTQIQGNSSILQRVPIYYFTSGTV